METFTRSRLVVLVHDSGTTRCRAAGWTVGLYLAMQPCAQVFQRLWLERVHG
ncbi:MAG TPA: hypothetical protein VLE46_15075 [Nitrospira sp.]|nr:hypothetical protein [Nitrospira sp.]